MFYMIKENDIQQMVQHWLSVPINGYLGSGYGNSAPELLQTPLPGMKANDLIKKLRRDVSILNALPTDSVNVYSVSDEVDKRSFFIDIIGTMIIVPEERQNSVDLMVAKTSTMQAPIVIEETPIIIPDVDVTPPTISLISPANGEVFTGSMIQLSASANDANTVAGVQFIVNGNNVGSELLNPPYVMALNSNTLPNGSYTLTSIARDLAGNATVSNSVTFVVNNFVSDTTAPIITITSPIGGATVSGSNVIITADASDNVSVTRVQFKINGVNLGIPVLSPPYTTVFDSTVVNNGTFTLSAVAFDPSSNSSISNIVSISVNNTPADTIAPTLSITSPLNGATLNNQSVTITANASDNVGVVMVQFKVDGFDVGGPDSIAPYTVTTALSDGLHSITAIAYDAVGNTVTANSVSITVDTIAPTVSITSPINGSTVSGAMVSLSAISPDAVAVQFKIDGLNYGTEDFSAPYVVSLNSTTLSNGSHVVTAQARDSAGNSSLSNPVSFTVTNVGANLKTYTFTTTSYSSAPTIPSVGALATWTPWTTPALVAGFNYLHNNGKKAFQYNGQRPRSPSFATEDDGVSLRVLPWTQRKYGIDRWYFWESTYWNNFQGNTGQMNVFKTAQTFGFNSIVNASKGETGSNYSNGDGVLFYPGTDLQFPSVSKGVNGPMASLRMKHWRRGIQDMDYLEMAWAINPTAVNALLNSSVTALFDVLPTDVNDPTYGLGDIGWSINPSDWEARRIALANIIKGV